MKDLEDCLSLGRLNVAIMVAFFKYMKNCHKKKALILIIPKCRAQYNGLKLKESFNGHKTEQKTLSRDIHNLCRDLPNILICLYEDSARI